MCSRSTKSRRRRSTRRLPPMRKSFPTSVREYASAPGPRNGSVWIGLSGGEAFPRARKLQRNSTEVPEGWPGPLRLWPGPTELLREPASASRDVLPELRWRELSWRCRVGPQWDAGTFGVGDHPSSPCSSERRTPRLASCRLLALLQRSIMAYVTIPSSALDTRTDLLNHLVRARGYERYLEIGVADPRG